MSEIRFYHLQQRSLEQTLPAILMRAVERQQRAVVMLGSAERAEALSGYLWTFDPNSFLPHGTAKDGHAAEQPVYLTINDENPNGAELLILADGATSARIGDYKLCCEIFDGNDADALKAARERWAAYKQAGHTLVYYQQNDDGKWEQKAAA